VSARALTVCCASASSAITPLQFAGGFPLLIAVSSEPRHAGPIPRDVRPEAQRFVHNGVWTA